MFRVPNQRRIVSGELASTEAFGNNGAFYIPYTHRAKSVRLLCIASDGEGWEHVSVSPNRPRCPYWDEMTYVRHIFWEKEDVVMQLHPPASEYVNHHPYTLHLWRRAGTDDYLERPPAILVGPPTGDLDDPSKTS